MVDADRLSYDTVNDLYVSGVRVRKIVNEKVKAVVDITLNNAFAIHGIRIVDKKEKGLQMVMPNHKNARDEWHDICHPISAPARKMIEIKVFEEFDRINKLSENIKQD
jgi:stage V sporulation protein G